MFQGGWKDTFLRKDISGQAAQQGFQMILC
jgi:hypothetical protein